MNYIYLISKPPKKYLFKTSNKFYGELEIKSWWIWRVPLFFYFKKSTNMTDVDKCNAVSFDLIFPKLWIQTKNVWLEFLITSPLSWKISKGGYRYNPVDNAVYDEGKKTRPVGNPFPFVKNHLQLTTPETVDWFSQNWLIKKWDRKKTEPNIKKSEILSNPEKFIIWNDFNMETMLWIKTWLKHRGFTQDYIDSYEWEIRIKEVFKYFWFVKNPATKKVNGEWLPSRPCIIFPGRNSEDIITQIKLRKTNNLREDENDKDSMKSIQITWSKAWVLYHDLEFILSQEEIIVCEWEPDYVVLRMLGIDNVICNSSGAWNARDVIRSLVKNIEKVVVAYDNDEAWKNAFEALSRFCKRQMIYPKYKDIFNEEWEKYKDINDYFEGWYTKQDFLEMFKWHEEASKEISIPQNKEVEKYLNALENKNPLIYIRSQSSFYDTTIMKYVSMQEAVMNTWIKANDLIEMRINGQIPMYYDLCYKYWGKPYHYNTLLEDSILKPSNNPVLHEDIKKFIENLAWWKKEDYEWIYKAILYKHSHINDVLVPALVITSEQWVGKGTFINFTASIFWQENTLYWLRTQELLSDKDWYSGNKIIVDLDEIEAWNHKEAKQISAKLKSMIFKNPMPCRVMRKDFKNVDNIAWFIISSNDTKPILLDSWLNRRYMVVEWWHSIDNVDIFWENFWSRLNEEVIKNPEIMSDFLAWLYQEYPEVPKMTRFHPIENDSKKLLEDISKSSTHKFFEWLQEKYPNILRISNREKDVLVEEYRIEMQEEWFDYEYKYNKRYFNNDLPRYVKTKKIRVRDKSVNWYEIKWWWTPENCFQDDKIENKLINA